MGMGPQPQQMPPSVRPQIMGREMEPDADADDRISAKAPREQAGFRAASERCGVCMNFSQETGECSKVEGQMSPEDTCAAYFEPMQQDVQQMDMGAPPPAV